MQHVDSSGLQASKRDDDLKEQVHADDQIIIENIVTSIESLGTKQQPLFVNYKLDVIPTGYVVRARLPQSDIFEMSIDDLLFLQSISPSRIESISICRTSTNHAPELRIKVLDKNQRVMIASSVHFSCTRKRKFNSVLGN